MDPIYNEGPRDWQNLCAITRFHDIEVLFHYFSISGVKKNNCLLYWRLHLILATCPFPSLQPKNTSISQEHNNVFRQLLETVMDTRQVASLSSHYAGVMLNAPNSLQGEYGTFIVMSYFLSFLIQTVLHSPGIRILILKSLLAWPTRISLGNLTEKWSLRIPLETWRRLSRTLLNLQTGQDLCMSWMLTTQMIMALRTKTSLFGWGLLHFQHSASFTERLSSRANLRMVCQRGNMSLISNTVSSYPLNCSVANIK